MVVTFPPGVGVSQVRGIVNIVRGNGGSVSLSELAEQAEEDVDDLLPLIEAGRLLGFITIVKTKVKITPFGDKLATSSPRKVLRECLPKVEPFKSTVKALSSGGRSTMSLFEFLNSRGVFPEDGDHSDETLMKLLLSWGVRTKLLNYDELRDIWTLKK